MPEKWSINRIHLQCILELTENFATQKIVDSKSEGAEEQLIPVENVKPPGRKKITLDRTRSKGDEKQVGADSKVDQKLPPKKRPHVPPGNSEEKNDEESLENREDLSIPKTKKKKDDDLLPLSSRRDEGKRYQLCQTENRTTMDTIEGKIPKQKQD